MKTKTEPLVLVLNIIIKENTDTTKYSLSKIKYTQKIKEEIKEK